MVTIIVQSRSRGKGNKLALSFTLELPKEATIADAKRAVHTQLGVLHPTCQRLALPVGKEGEKSKALADEVTIGQLGLKDGAVLELKDLGPQASWTTVFVIEYLGPLLIHPLAYHLPKLFYGRDFEKSKLQQVVYALVMLHFLKRELETLFVHRFSHATMPFTYIFRNSAHYWLLSGVLMAGALYGPWNSAQNLAGTKYADDTFLWSCVAAWTVFQLCNLHSHLTLRWLRPAGTKKRGIPRGFMFEYVSCPNYFFEILGWTVVTYMTGSPAALIFLLVGSGTMTLWAVKKHKNYKREFGKEYPRGRKAVFPFIF